MRDEPQGQADPDQWLNRSPTEGDANAFMPGSGGGGGIDVNPDGVKVFASQANGEAADFRTSLSNGVNELIPEAAKIGNPFYEAEAFALEHGAGVEALMLFSQDAGKGLMALGMGAASIAVTYINGDATSSATLSDVQNAFDVSGGTGMFNGPSAPDQNQAATPGDRLGNATGRDEHQNYVPRDPHAAHTIDLGRNDSYTIPGDAPDDLERLDNNELRDVHRKFADDLEKTD
ncbi:MAG: hypothetical protein M3400_13405 [Actinomycetota bacterium]|nr:hypothetical protein [Actinomycetota bacterium]